MPSENDGTMVILSSPSGAGKTTLVNLLAKHNNFHISISHTTRKPRDGEIPNKDYYFVNDKEFKRLINNQEFLEYAKVFNNYYGTTRTPIIDSLDKGKNVLLFGSEGYGLKAKTLQNSDFKFKININKNIESLNISNTVSVVCHHIFQTIK